MEKRRVVDRGYDATNVPVSQRNCPEKVSEDFLLHSPPPLRITIPSELMRTRRTAPERPFFRFTAWIRQQRPYVAPRAFRPSGLASRPNRPPRAHGADPGSRPTVPPCALC